MRRGIWIGLVVLVASVLFGSAAQAQSCPPTCTCNASYNGGICHSDWGPCPNGSCAFCSCTSTTGCVGGCVPKSGMSGGGGGSCAGIGRCLMWMEADALTLTGLADFIGRDIPPGWTVAVIGDDDGTRATFAGPWTLEDILRLHYGRRLEVDHERKTAKILR